MSQSDSMFTQPASPRKQPMIEILREVIPQDTSFFVQPLRNRGTWLMLIFAMAPVAFNFFFGKDVATLRLLISAYFTLAWATYLYASVGQRAVNLWLGLGSALFMLFVGVPIGQYLHFHILTPFYEMATSPSSLINWIGNVLSHGLNEEGMKAMSVLLLAFVLRQVRKPIDGLFCGALSGLGFAAWEGHSMLAEAQTPGVMMMTVVIRGTTNCLLHASWTGISGYFIALAALRQSRFVLSALGILIAMVLHGTYDFKADVSPVALVPAAASYVLFRYCAVRSDLHDLATIKAFSR